MEDEIFRLNIVAKPNLLPLLLLSDNGISIRRFDSTKDLGSTVDGSSKQPMYFAHTFKRAHAALFFVRRSLVTLTPEIFITLYST